MHANVTAAVITYPDVEIPVSRGTLEADLELASNPRGLIVFVDGSGGGRNLHNCEIASRFGRMRLATMLPDLLTVEEQAGRRRGAAVDAQLLGDRLVTVTDWCRHDWSTRDLPIGYFGTRGGLAAAWAAATRRPHTVFAIVNEDNIGDLEPNVPPTSVIHVASPSGDDADAAASFDQLGILAADWFLRQFPRVYRRS